MDWEEGLAKKWRDEKDKRKTLIEIVGKDGMNAGEGDGIEDWIDPDEELNNMQAFYKRSTAFFKEFN